MFDFKTNWLWLAMLAVLFWFLGGCATLEGPVTKIGLVGYVNRGYEKSIHMSGRYDPETGFVIVESLDVTNDATKAYDAQQFLVGALQQESAANRQLLMDLITAGLPIAQQYADQNVAARDYKLQNPKVETVNPNLQAILDRLTAIEDAMTKPKGGTE